MKQCVKGLRWLITGIFLALLLSLLTGCGYRLVGASTDTTPHISVAVPVFRNLTYRAAGEGVFTEAVVQALLRHGVSVRDAATADYIVTGEIVSFTSTGEAFSATDTTVLYRAEAEIAFTIQHRQRQEVVVRERIRRRVDYPAQTLRALQPSVDAAATEALAAQVAQTVLVRLLDLQSRERTP
jgi:outer membrane lipopolysaccharide assembly protein LptE/RlpB